MRAALRLLDSCIGIFLKEILTHTPRSPLTTQEFACAKEREKTGAQSTTALIEGAWERGEGGDYSLTGRALVAAAGSASGSGAALATVLGRGPKTPMRQVRVRGRLRQRLGHAHKQKHIIALIPSDSQLPVKREFLHRPLVII